MYNSLVYKISFFVLLRKYSNIFIYRIFVYIQAIIIVEVRHFKYNMTT